jgi:hypothetical protein
MATVFAITKRILATLTFTIYTLKLRFNEFIQIRILKNHSKISVLKKALDLKPKRVAVVALFPRGFLLTSTLRLVDRLILNGYQVVAVLNEGRPQQAEWIDELATRDLTILSRKNIGRDFGAYQAGIHFVQNLDGYSSIERLVIANDSVYYFPTSNEFLDKLLQNQHQWCGMFINFEIHIHAQSFFESFDRPVFTSSVFKQFWQNFYPTSIRHNVINKGEVGLTTVLMTAGFNPKSFVSGTIIEKSRRFKDFTPEEKFGLWNGFHFTTVDGTPSPIESHKLQMRRVLIESNPTHRAGMLSTRILGAPLKLDLLRTGLASASGLIELARNCGIETEELARFEDEILSKGSHVSVVGLHRLWRSYGFD